MFFIHWPLVKIKKGKAVGGAKAQPAQVTQQSWFNIFTSLEPCYLQCPEGYHQNKNDFQQFSL